jgi:hypothetical protein
MRVRGSTAGTTDPCNCRAKRNQRNPFPDRYWRILVWRRQACPLILLPSWQRLLTETLAAQAPLFPAVYGGMNPLT